MSGKLGRKIRRGVSVRIAQLHFVQIKIDLVVGQTSATQDVVVGSALVVG